MIHPNSLSLTLLFTIVALWATATSYKILIIPVEHSSHVNFFSAAGRALSEAGHDVRVLTVEKHRKTVEGKNIKGFFHKPIKAVSFQDTEQFKSDVQASSSSGWGSPLQMFHNMANLLLIQFEEIMANKELVSSIESYGFDIAIVDGLKFARLNYIIPYRLGIPYITLTSFNDPMAARVPAMPSFEPNAMIEVIDKMSFFERIKNLIAQLGLIFLIEGDNLYPTELIKKYAPGRPDITFLQLYRKSEMFLLNIDIYGLDYPRVSMPHFIYIGGLGTEDAKPLPNDVESFVQKAEHGVIIMSFGSVIKDCSPEILDKFFKAFRQVKQRVVMTLDGEFPQRPSNVLILKWLPQNDIIGHPKTRLFITHGGINGQLEAMYHGVPMLVMPFNGDQFYNAKRTEAKGLGKRMNFKSFEVEELVNTIKELTKNETYSLNMKRASKIVRSLPSPRSQVVFWTEHIVKYGGSHLRSYSIDMPGYQYYMLDIIGFLLFILMVIIFITHQALKLLVRKCCGWITKTEKQKTS